MLSKEFKKYHTDDVLKKYAAPFKYEFTNEQYVLFMRKFRGTMIYRGKSSLSYKYMDRIWVLLKKYMKKQRIYQDTALLFKQAIFNLIPLISVGNLKRGKKVEAVPVLLKQKRRMAFINKWLIRSQKNKTNVRGIKIDNIAKLIYTTVLRKGSAYDQKMENQKRALAARYVLLRKRSTASEIRGFNQLQKVVLNKLRERAIAAGLDDKKKEVVLNDDDYLKKYLLAFKFVKKSFHNKYLKRHKKGFKKFLRNAWDLPVRKRLYALIDWYTTIGSSPTAKKLVYNKELLEEFLKKYKHAWKKKKEIF